MTREPHKKPDPSECLLFGKTFTDHMLMVEWNMEKGWGRPRIQPFQNLTLHPACSALHYSLQVAGRLPSLPASLRLSAPLLGFLLALPAWVCFLGVFHFPALLIHILRAPCWVTLHTPR